MKKIYKIFMAVAAVAAVGCTTDATEDLGVNLNEGPTTLTLSLDDTRTQLGEKADGTYPLTWAENDAISVNGSVSKALAEDEAGATSATFTFKNSFGSTPYFIAYPAVENTTNQVVFAAEQTHTSNTTFGNGAAVMYGYATDLSNVTLSHLTGVLKIGIVSGTEELTFIKEVRISTVDRKPIAGAFNVDAEGKLTATEGATEVITYKAADDASIIAPMGTATSENPNYIYVVVPAGTYGELFVTLESADGVMYKTITTDSTKPINAGAVREFSNNIEFVPTDEAEVFVISNYGDLCDYKEAVEKGSTLGAVLVNDIELPAKGDVLIGQDWASINAPEYAAEFNGNGYAIKGLYAPLFDTVAATIKGVHLKDVKIAKEYASANTGALVNTYTGTSITHCSAEGTITLTRANSVVNKIGGLVGTVSNFTTDWEISDCVNNCAITVALTKDETSQTTFVGGIMGDYYIAAEDAAATTVTLSNNTNNSAISLTGETGAIVGVSGIAARLYSCNLVLTDCANIGSVSAELSASIEFHVSGIVGRYVAGYNLTATNCYNSGKISANITAANTTTAYSSAGGCFGYLANSAGGLLTINNCDNSANIEVEATTSIANQLHIGGLAGCLYSIMDVQNCENTGEKVLFNGQGLSHRFNLGGLAGRVALNNSSDTTNENGLNVINFKTCTNAADVSMTDGGTISHQVFVGGVIASSYALSTQRATFTYDDLDNNGNITVSSKDWTYTGDKSSGDALDVPRLMVGGVLGTDWIDDSSSTGSNYSSFCITNCNNGDEKSVNTKKILITGEKNYSVSVGGIVGVRSYGTPKSNATTYPSKIDGCKNYMTIEHSATTTCQDNLYLGGICGMASHVQRYQRVCFHNSTNYGNINANAANVTDNISVSGVLAVQRNHQQRSASNGRKPAGVTMENVYNKGTINVGGTTGFTCTNLRVGGLVGEAELLAYAVNNNNSYTVNNNHYILTDVANVGNINVSNVTGTRYIGGALGQDVRLGGSRTYTNFKSHCTITVSEGYNAGMLAGMEPTGSVKFSNCEVGGTLVKGATSTLIDAANVTQYSFGATTAPNALYASVTFLATQPVVE